MTEQARLGNQTEDYKKLNLIKEIKPWEDGLRTNPDGENYEWWYFDAHLDDGSDLVITFYDKSMTHPTSGLKPAITIDLNRPDGTTISDELSFNPTDFQASTDKCNVKIGSNYFQGNLNQYSIKATTQNVSVLINSKNIVPSWRPETGYFYFGNQDEYNFSWLPAIPKGEASIDLTINGTTEKLTGICYHDHNWGNIQMLKLMHHWYWGRANIDNYTVISSYITAEKKYGYQEFPIFMLAKNDKIIGDDPEYLTFSKSDIFIEPRTKKPVPRNICYDYNDGNNHYKVTYLYEKTILNSPMIELLPPIKKAAAKLAKFDGAYLRFSGTVKLEVFDKSDNLIETHQDRAIWEEMYFGKTIKN